MKALCSCLLFVLCIPSLGSSVCRAQGLAIAVTTNAPGNTNQIIFGCTATYTVTGNPPVGGIKSVQWAYQQTGPTCVTAAALNWQDSDPPLPNFGFSKWLVESYPGAFTVNAKVTYQAQQNQDNQNPPLLWTVISVSVVVPPPDGILRPINPASLTVSQGTVPPGQQPVPGTFATFNFQITCNNVPIPSAANISGVNENITNRFTYVGGAMVLLDPQVNVAQAGFFGLSNTSIFDLKLCSIVAPLNTVVEVYMQELHVEIADMCGHIQPYTLGQVRVTTAYNNVLGQVVFTVE